MRNLHRAPSLNTNTSPKGKNLINSPYKSANAQFSSPKAGTVSPTNKVQFPSRKNGLTRLNTEEVENGSTVSSNFLSKDMNSPSSKNFDVDYKLYENLFKSKRKHKISVGVHSTQGFRNTMEDEHFFIRDLDVKANIQTSFGTHAMFGVFDGHSGKDAATFCKYQLFKYICKNKNFNENVEKAITEGFLECDEAFRKYAVEEEKASPTAGCTGIIGYVREGSIFVGSCGDSRAVMGVGGRTIPMSDDHKPSRPDEKKRIEALGGRVEYGRVGGLLAVSRAFGDFEYKQNGKPLVTAKPDVQTMVLTKDADFIIVACDGLWDVISSKEAVKFAYPLLLEFGDPTKVCEKLVDKALDRRSMDNITCMIVLFRELNV